MLIMRIPKRELTAVFVAVSLLSGIITNMKGATGQDLVFIDLTEALLNAGFNDDTPIGIECGDPTFVYVTINSQGLLARIEPIDIVVVDIIDDPDTNAIINTQNFYSIARDPNTNNLFINERDNGKLWRFNPSAPLETAWDRIPIVQEVVDQTPEDGLPVILYPEGFDVSPVHVMFDTDNDGTFEEDVLFGATSGTIVFTNDHIWVGLVAIADFSDTVNLQGVDDILFAGLVKVDPITLEVERISLLESGVAPGDGLVVDSDDPNILWISDFIFEQIAKFDATPGVESLLETLPLDPGSVPSGIVTDSDNVFVALNKPGGFGENSLIARINKSPLQPDPVEPIIDTEALNTFSGTFTVFVNGGLLVWTDGSSHVGTIDLNTNEKTVKDTITNTNFFGCVPIDGEFWFAGEGSAFVGILPNSKFSVGVGVGRARPTGAGGGGGHGGRYQPFSDPESPNYDDEAPLIGEVFTVPGSFTVYAQISDRVGVKDANIMLDKKTSIPMEFHLGSVNWWFGTIPSDIASGTVFFKIVARDFNDNVAEYEGSADISAGSSSTDSGSGAGAFVISALPYEQQMDPAYSITASATQFDSSIPAMITIKNTSNEPLQNIRILLSPELKGKFLLSEYAIKSIDPKSEYTVSIMLNGKLNVDAMKQPIQYKGQIIISVDNRTPYIYELSGKTSTDYSLNLFMNNIMSKAEQRYRSFAKPDLRISGDANYQVTLGSGNNAIRSASDEIIIRNTGDKPLKNLRIITSTLGNHFLPDQKNISFIPAGTYLKVKLLSNLNSNESPNLKGELLVVPEVGMPVTIPIEIGKIVKEDRNAKYEVTTLSGNDIVSNTADGLIIKNSSSEAIKNMRIVLTRGLEGVFSLSEDSFKSIEPDDEKIVYLQQRGTMDSASKQILNNYYGEIIILSDNGMKKLVPVEIAWKNISSKHFIVYARNNGEELIKATHLINFLERNYGRVVEITGELTNTKTVIYMPTSLDEMRKITDTQTMSTYMHNKDIAFVYSKSEDISTLALKEFVYRMIMNNHATYWANQKIYMDRGNWLIDGLSNYVAARIVGEQGMINDQINAFVGEPTSLEWYGSGTLSQYGATYTLFEFLSEKYGDMVIDRILYYLGSSMISNHRCDTFEQCTLLRAVYDVRGLDINEKRYALNFDMIMKGWEEYMNEVSD
jgi:hypothetical protein